MRIPLLHRLPFLSGSHREATPNPLDFRPLPSGTDKADAKVWTERLGDAQRLLGEMKRDIDLSVARAAQRPVQSMAAPMRAISPLTLLKTLLPGQKRGEAPAPELHANRVAQGAVVMAAPRDKEAVLWAAACVQHHIGHVVDLSTFPESQAIGSCMGRGDHRTRGRLIARFDAAEGIDDDGEEGAPVAKKVRKYRRTRSHDRSKRARKRPRGRDYSDDEDGSSSSRSYDGDAMRAHTDALDMYV